MTHLTFHYANSIPITDKQYEKNIPEENIQNQSYFLS
jgi:hypothetical protein